MDIRRKKKKRRYHLGSLWSSIFFPVAREVIPSGVTVEFLATLWTTMRRACQRRKNPLNSCFSFFFKKKDSFFTWMGLIFCIMSWGAAATGGGGAAAIPKDETDAPDALEHRIGDSPPNRPADGAGWYAAWRRGSVTYIRQLINKGELFFLTTPILASRTLSLAAATIGDEAQAETLLLAVALGVYTSSTTTVFSWIPFDLM